MVVNGIPSACNSPLGQAGCAFIYNASVVASIGSVSPTTFIFNSSVTSPMNMTITGSGFSANTTGNEVLLDDGSVCTVLTATATRIVCALPTTTSAGARTVRVRVAGVGYANGAPFVNVRAVTVRPGRTLGGGLNG